MSTPADDWDTATTTVAATAPADPDPKPPEPRYSGVEAWVTQHLLPTYLRQSGPRTWCPQWWQHPEAVERLEALWRAWESLRLDATTGMSVWWRDHADHHLPILLSPDGPFARCAARSHQNPPTRCPPKQPHPTGGSSAPTPKPRSNTPHLEHGLAVRRCRGWPGSPAGG